MSHVAVGLPASGLLRLPQIIGDQKHPGPLPISKSKFYALIREGVVPPPRKIGRVSAWPVESIRPLIQGKPEAA
jgi:predicted DNA-binding transcriptional regulator AlpA